MTLLKFIPGAELLGVITYTILSDEKQIPGTIQVNSILVDKEINKIPYAKLVIFDGEASKENFAVSSSDLFSPGRKITILAGYGSTEKKIFTGIVIKHSIMHKRNKSSVLEIECKDEAVKLTVGRKNKYFTSGNNKITDSAAISDILKDQFESKIEDTHVEHASLVQYYSTDWDFIVSRAEVNSKVVIVENGKFIIEKPDLLRAPVLSLNYGDTVFEFEAEIDARYQFKEVLGKSWSPSNNAVVEEDSKDALPPNTPKQGSLSSNALAEIIDLDHYLLQHSGNIINTELKAWTEAKMLKSRLSKIKGQIKFQGSSDVKPGSTIELGGMGNKFNGIAYVSSARHEIYEGTWYTTVNIGLDFEWFSDEHSIEDKPAAALLPAVTGLQIGLVTKIEADPDSNDRIQVKIPVVNNGAQGTWARMLRPDAGNKRGVVFRPEVGDEVLVGFLNDDPRDPVILGSLNNSKIPSAIPATKENDIKGIVTKSGLQFLFDDKSKEIKIETPGKRILSVNDEKGLISFGDNNGNKIEMSENGIVIESKKNIVIKTDSDISLEGLNVKQKAKKEIQVEGTTNALLKSGAQINIKGAKVNIN